MGKREILCELSVAAVIDYLFTGEAQRTLRVGIFCLSGDDDKQKGLHLEDYDLWLGCRPGVFCPIAVSRLGKSEILCELSVSAVEYLYTDMFVSDFDIRISDFISKMEVTYDPKVDHHSNR